MIEDLERACRLVGRRAGRWPQGSLGLARVYPILPRSAAMDTDHKAAEKPTAKCVEDGLGPRELARGATGDLQHTLLVMNINS